MTDEKKKTRVAVVGAGPGGYAAAFLAADLGLEVTLIDPDHHPGGVCLYRGCIPSKTLLHAARLIREVADAREWGIAYGPPQIDVNKLRSWKQRVVKSLTEGLGQLSRQRKIRSIQGRARFAGEHEIVVEGADGSRESVPFDHAVVATGSRPSGIPGLDIQSDRIIDSTAALELEDVPRSLLVVGGGYIGLELGTVYAALGSRVTVVEMMPTLLPGVDSDMVSVLHKKLSSVFDSILLETTVSRMTEVEGGVKVLIRGKEKDEKEITVDKVLVAVGRKPNSQDLGLEDIGVEVSERGFVTVDPSRRTSVPSIFAIGDVAGEPMLAHKASHEGRVAAESIAGGPAAFDPRAIPAVVFTDPEIAWCGLTEREARETNRKVDVARFPWAASGRAKTLGRTDGMTKLLIDPGSEFLLGAAIVGAGAGELIAECVLAIEMGATARDLALTIHPHPTLSETVMEAAEVFFGQSTHLYRPRKR